MWETILPHLRTLWIVAKQPLEDDHYWNGHTVIEKMKEWIEWLTLILECLAKTLSTKSTVLVDVDRGEETGQTHPEISATWLPTNKDKDW